MPLLTDAQIAQYAISAGFTVNGTAPMAVAIALAESGGNSGATHVNSDGSIDRGLWQINNRYHAEISDVQAFNPASAAAAAYAISNRGANWKQWSTYNNGRYLAYLGRGQAASLMIYAGSIAGTHINTVIPPATTNNGSSGGAFGEMFAWLGVIVLASIANKTRIGHTIIYDLMALAIISLLLINAKSIQTLFAPLTHNQGALQASQDISQAGALAGSMAGSTFGHGVNG